MHTMHPLVFVRFKRWMGGLATRDAKKRERDLLQARIVEQIVDAHLPHLRQADLGPALELPDQATHSSATQSTK